MATIEQAGITLTGVQAIDKQFNELPNKLRKQALRKASREVAKLTQKFAKQAAPKKTGQLRSAIKVRSAGRKHIANALNITHRDAAKHFIGARVISGIRNDEHYGWYLEFGTTMRTTASGASRGRIAPEKFSFLRPALWRFQHHKRRMFEASVRRWIRQQHVTTKPK